MKLPHKYYIEASETVSIKHISSFKLPSSSYPFYCVPRNPLNSSQSLLLLLLDESLTKEARKLLKVFLEHMDEDTGFIEGVDADTLKIKPSNFSRSLRVLLRLNIVAKIQGNTYSLVTRILPKGFLLNPYLLTPKHHREVIPIWDSISKDF